ncbi:MAG: hypothetical protein K2M07_03880 [Muribaculaceae bacterium]|nr:hypothetical protein [Muribaculaceae bacterium]
MPDNTENMRKTPRTMLIIFGVIMIIIYVGMGSLLLFTPFFSNVITIDWIRYVLGGAFILYGIWRAVRQFRFNMN